MLSPQERQAFIGGAFAVVIAVAGWLVLKPKNTPGTKNTPNSGTSITATGVSNSSIIGVGVGGTGNVVTTIIGTGNTVNNYTQINTNLFPSGFFENLPPERKAALTNEIKSHFTNFNAVMIKFQQFSHHAFTNVLQGFATNTLLHNPTNLFYLYINEVRTPLDDYLHTFPPAFEGLYTKWEHLPENMQVERALAELFLEWTKDPNASTSAMLWKGTAIIRDWIFNAQGSFYDYATTTTAAKYK